MADDVAITAGSGTNIATDDCSGRHVQLTKLAISTDGSATMIPADATNGLRMSRAADTLPTATVMQNAATAIGNGTSMNVQGFASVMLLLNFTGAATVVTEVSVDDTTWTAVAMYLATGSGEANAVLGVSTSGQYRVNVAGAKSLRARIDMYLSGTVTATGYASQASLQTIAAFVHVNGASITGDQANGLDVDVTRIGGLGTVSTVNSSIAALGAAGVFTGTAEYITDYSVVTVSVIANVASATDGLSIQQSSDGTNWDVADVYTIAAATAKHVTVQCALQFLRVVYTNGGGAQSSFRLQTIFHRMDQRGSSVRPMDARVNDTDMEEVLAYQMVFNGATWDRVRGTAGDVAHGVTNAGNPVQQGAQAIAHGTNPTAVTAGQRTRLYANRAGVPFVIGGHPNIVTVRLNITTAVTDTAVVTVASGLKIVVTSFMFTLDNASTVFPKVTLGFGTANTPTTTGVIGAHGGVPAGGGFGRGDGSGIIGIGADNEDLRVTTVGAATGNGLDLVVAYYTIES